MFWNKGATLRIVLHIVQNKMRREVVLVCLNQGDEKAEYFLNTLFFFPAGI